MISRSVSSHGVASCSRSATERGECQSKIFQCTALLTCTFATHGSTALSRSYIADFRGHWVEYGVVEQRYAQRNPQDCAMLVERYGHTAIPGKSYTTSAFLAHTLGDLSKYGSVPYHWGPATGRWHYNSQISWWAVPPEPQWSAEKSWEALGCSVTYVPGQTETPTTSPT